MPVHFPTGSEYLKRINGLASLAGDYTACFWTRVGADPTGGNYRTHFMIVDDPTVYLQYVWIGSNIDTNDLLIGLANNSDPPTGSAVGVPLAADAWVHVAYTRAGNVHCFYVNALLIDTLTLDVAANSQGAIVLGNDTFSVGDLSFAYFREWTGALTAAELLAERLSNRAVRQANLWTDTPLEGSLRDVSGRGHHWLRVGSISYGASSSLVLPSKGGAIVVDCYSDHDLQDPGSYYGGFKDGLIKSFGDIDRPPSHPVTGDIQASTFSFTIIDKERRLREQFASDTQRYWNQSLACRMTTRANRAVLGTPFTAFVGQIVDAQPREGLLWEVTLADAVTESIVSDQMVQPWRKIGDGFLSQLTTISPDLDRDTPEYIIYGPHRRIVTVDVASPEGFRFKPDYLGIIDVDGDAFYVGLICGHALSEVFDASICDFSDPASPVITSVIADEGTTWLIPTMAGFLSQFGTPYQDLRSDTYGNLRRYSLIYGKVGEPDPDAWAAGEKTLLISLMGMETNGDGSGLPITDRLEQYEDFMINYVANAGPNSYQTGLRLTNPTHDIIGTAVPKIDTASFAQCAAIAAERLPSAGSPPSTAGYLGAAVIGRGGQESIRKWIADWNRSCSVRSGFNHWGQFHIWMLHPTAATKAAAPLYTDAYEIRKNGFDPRAGWDQWANAIPGKADFDYLGGQWTTIFTATADDSVRNWQQTKLGEPREYPFAPGITAAYHLALMEVRVLKNPPMSYVVEDTVGPRDDGRSAGYLDHGDYIRVRHYEAVSHAVDEERLMQVVRPGVRVNSRRCFVEVIDVEDLIGYDMPPELSDSGSPSSPNDTCAFAIDLGDLSADFVQTYDTSTHAEDSSVTGVMGRTGYKAAWFSLTAPADGQLTVGTLLSDYDTQLAVFTGDCGDLALEDYNDNWTEGQTTSEIVMPVTNGTTYKILAAGYFDLGGFLKFAASFVAL